MSLQAAEVDGHVAAEFDADHVVIAGVRRRRPADVDRRDVGDRTHDRFGVQEAGGQRTIVARRAHGDRQALQRPAVRRGIAEPDLQGFLDRNPVRQRLAPALPALFNVDGEAALSHACYHLPPAGQYSPNPGWPVRRHPLVARAALMRIVRK